MLHKCKVFVKLKCNVTQAQGVYQQRGLEISVNNFGVRIFVCISTFHGFWEAQGDQRG